MPRHSLLSLEEHIKDEIDQVRNADGSCVSDAVEILKRISEYAAQCEGELQSVEPEKQETITA